MPIFEFKCNQCNKEFEKLFFAGEEKKAACPDCSSDDVKKVMSAARFMGPSIGTCASDSPKGFS